MSESSAALTPPLPRSVYVETSSRCDSLCQTCILTFGGREPKRDITWEEFRRIVDQFPALDRVVLHGVGEPLLNRELPRMIAHSKERGAAVVFNSNAISLNAKAARALVDSGLDEIRVSLDASTPATYARVRGVDVFEKVLKNLEGLAALKRELPAAKPRVSLWFTTMESNVSEIPGLVPLALRVGAAGVYIQRLVYYGQGLAVEAQSLHGRLGAREAALIRDAESAARSAGLEFSASGAAAAEASMRPSEADRPWSACRRPWTLTYVTAGGNVLSCCFAPWITGHYEGAILGNIFRESLEEVWWGKRYQEFRRAIQTPEPPETCRNCGVRWSL